MNYENIYNQLIEKAKSRNLKKLDKTNPNYIYLEEHHIIPKCLGGTNTSDNLVNLTYREHYFAHLLLTMHFKRIRDKNGFYKMQKALQAFQNLAYGTIRNNMFFATSLFKNLIKNMTMSESTKQKLSKSHKGKTWSLKARLSNQAYYKRLKELGIKMVPWNKGIPLSQKAKDKMRATIAKYGNKNRGKKLPLKDKISEIQTKLKKLYSMVDFSQFDFETYATIPKNQKYTKKENIMLSGKYKRNVMLTNFLLTQITQEQIDQIRYQHSIKYNTKNRKKASLSTKIKVFTTKFTNYYKIDFSKFDFVYYFNIEHENKEIRRQLRKQFVLKYVTQYCFS